MASRTAIQGRAGACSTCAKSASCNRRLTVSKQFKAPGYPDGEKSGVLHRLSGALILKALEGAIVEKKTKKSAAIPLRAFADYSKHNDRNYDSLVQQIIHMRTRYVQLTMENDRQGLNVYSIEHDGKGWGRVLVNECENQVRARQAIQDAELLRDAIKEERKTLLNMGKKISELNQEKASLDRPIKNEDDQTIDDVIKCLARTHTGEKPSQVWTHLKSAIEGWAVSDTVREIGGIGDSRMYQFTIDDKKDTISYGTFRKKVAKIK